MNNFVIDTPDNFWQIRWLDKYMEGHKGFIAGGCFKNILSGERVKDIDIFFESESDFQEAIDSFNDEKHQKEGWKFKYRNEKVCAFQKEGEYDNLLKQANYAPLYNEETSQFESLEQAQEYLEYVQSIL